MEKYKVQLSVRAKNDYKKIVAYLKNELAEPSIAYKYVELIINELQTLEYYPERHALIDYDIAKKLEFRKIIIKNYIAFYKINKKEKIIEVHRILYGASNWTKKI